MVQIYIYICIFIKTFYYNVHLINKNEYIYIYIIDIIKIIIAYIN